MLQHRQRAAAPQVVQRSEDGEELWYGFWGLPFRSFWNFVNSQEANIEINADILASLTGIATLSFTNKINLVTAIKAFWITTADVLPTTLVLVLSSAFCEHQHDYS